MKLVPLFLGLLFSFSAFAQRDSVAFFYRPHKIDVLLNERGEVSRLQNFMNYFEAGHELSLLSEDHDIKIQCARLVDKATCTLTFYPSTDVLTVNRELQVTKRLSSFGLERNDEFEMHFQGSMKDNFHLVINDGVLTISASKK